jgi:transposase
MYSVLKSKSKSATKATAVAPELKSKSATKATAVAPELKPKSATKATAVAPELKPKSAAKKAAVPLFAPLEATAVAPKPKLKPKRVKKAAVELTATSEDQVYIGLDVHKASYHVSVLKNGVHVTDWRTTADKEALVARLEPLRSGVKMIVYEAGPTGFSLARYLEKCGFPIMVCAPSKTPRASTVETKTDRLDALKLAEYASMGGLLKPVTIPTEEEAQKRSVSRLRDSLVDDIAKLKVQIKSTLLFHDLDDIESWSKKEREQFMAKELPELLRFELEMNFKRLAFLEEQRDVAMAKANEIIASDEELAMKSELLQSHPGIGEVVSASFLLEIFRPERFDSEAALSRYLGLAPGRHQSGQTCRDGPIMKAGQARLRSKLIEAAWRWRSGDEKARIIYNRIFARNAGRSGGSNKAIVALARRLAIRMWRMCVYGHLYKPCEILWTNEANRKVNGKAWKKSS